MELLVALVLFGLGGYRITRLLIQDEILDTPRNWLFTRIEPGSKLEYLLTCYHCLGFWVSIFLVILYVLFPTAMMVVILPFAISAVIGLISEKAN